MPADQPPMQSRDRCNRAENMETWATRERRSRVTKHRPLSVIGACSRPSQKPDCCWSPFTSTSTVCEHNDLVDRWWNVSGQVLHIRSSNCCCGHSRMKHRTTVIISCLSYLYYDAFSVCSQSGIIASKQLFSDRL